MELNESIAVAENGVGFLPHRRPAVKDFTLYVARICGICQLLSGFCGYSTASSYWVNEHRLKAYREIDSRVAVGLRIMEMPDLRFNSIKCARDSTFDDLLQFNSQTYYSI